MKEIEKKTLLMNWVEMEKIGLINIRISYESDESISTEVRLSEIMKRLMDDTQTNDLITEKMEHLDDILREMFEEINEKLGEMEEVKNV